MNRQELINKIADQGDLAKSAAAIALDIVLGSIGDALVNKEEVTLKGFGTFKPTTSAPRKGRNPSTGEALDIPAKNSVRFKAGSLLTAALNGK